MIRGSPLLALSGVTSPPPVPFLPSQLCDSTVDDEAKPTMYITYTDSQQYPEYLITFRH